MEDYEVLRRELTNLSKSRSNERPLDRRESKRSLRRQVTNATTRTNDEESAAANPDADGDVNDEDDFELDEFMREGHFEKRTEKGSAKKVGVVYRNLTVDGVGSTATFVKTLPDAILGTFGPDLYHLVARFVPFLRFNRGKRRTLINDFTGVVRDGE